LAAATSDQSGWQRWLPGLALIRQYPRDALRHDLTAGLVLTAMLLPTGIAYAEAAGIPGIYGLYATIVPLLAYAIFGPSRILVIGPDSALAALIAAVVVPLGAGDPDRAVVLGGALGLVAGIVCIAFGAAKLGFVTELLSKPIRYGFMNGIALTVLLSQVPKLLGFEIQAKGLLQDTWATTQTILAGDIHVTSTVIGLATLAAILILKRAAPRIPGVLLAVVVATIATALGDFANDGVEVLGVVPHGLPTPAFPLIGMADLVPVISGGFVIALVSFADTSVLSRTYAAKTNSPVDANREMIALGIANVAAGLFRGFPVCASASRTPVAETAGARTQLTSVVGAVAIGLLLLFAPRLLKDLPDAALAAVVIAAAMSLFELADLRRIFRIQQWEFWLSIVCFVGVAVFGAIEGIGIAIVIAVLEFLWDGWRPHSAVLGRVDNVKGYHDITRYPDARRVPGLVLFRWDAPLFFANAEHFHERVMEAVAAAPDEVRRVVVAAEPVTSMDVTAADVVAELDRSLHERGIELCFAEMKDPVKDKMKQFELFSQFGPDRFFATVGEAVSAYLDTYDVEWEDWEDRKPA
jgi:high affinity sulfate transporter 1